MPSLQTTSFTPPRNRGKSTRCCSAPSTQARSVASRGHEHVRAAAAGRETGEAPNSLFRWGPHPHGHHFG